MKPLHLGKLWVHVGRGFLPHPRLFIGWDRYDAPAGEIPFRHSWTWHLRAPLTARLVYGLDRHPRPTAMLVIGKAHITAPLHLVGVHVEYGFGLRRRSRVLRFR